MVPFAEEAGIAWQEMRATTIGTPSRLACLKASC